MNDVYLLTSLEARLRFWTNAVSADCKWGVWEESAPMQGYRELVWGRMASPLWCDGNL